MAAPLKLSLLITADASDAKAGVAEARAAITGLEQSAASSTARIGSVANTNSVAIGKSAQAAAGAMKLSAFETQNLARQISDVGVSLASGQSPFMVMVQQGAQIQDVFGSRGVRGILGGLVGGIASLMTPTTLWLAGITAVGYAASLAFDAIRGDVKDTNTVLAEHEAFIRRVGEAYPEIAKKAKEYARESDLALRVAGVRSVEDTIESLQSQLEAVASKYDFLINPQERLKIGGVRLMSPAELEDAAPFLDIIRRLGEESEKARPSIQGILDDINKIRLDPTSSAGMKAFADELLDATKEADELSRKLPVADQVLHKIGNTSKLAADQLDNYTDAMKRLGTVALPALTDQEQAFKSYFDARMNSGSLEESLNAWREYQNALERINSEAAGALVPVPTPRPNDIERLDDMPSGRNILQSQDDELQRMRLEISLIGATTAERTQAIATLKTEQEIRRSGIELYGEEANQIRANSAELASLDAQRQQSADAQRKLQETLRFEKDTFKGFFTDMIGGLREGKDAWESFADAASSALDRIADKFLDEAIGDVFGVLDARELRA